MTDQQDKVAARPFSWLLKPSLLDRPFGSLAHHLKHRQVEVLSESLRVAYEVVFKETAMKNKQKKFRADANRNPEKALDRIYELTALAVLRLRQWQFLEHEPSGKKGKRTPDHLMLAIEGPKILVEVKTLHLAEKIEKYDARKRALQVEIKRALAARGFDAEIHIYCSYRQIPPTFHKFESQLPALLSAIRENLKHGRLHTSYKLPNDGRIDINLKGKAEEIINTLAPEKLKEIDKVRLGIAKRFGGMGLELQQDGDFRNILGQRIAEAVKTKDKQIRDSGLRFPGVVAVCMGY